VFFLCEAYVSKSLRGRCSSWASCKRQVAHGVTAPSAAGDGASSSHRTGALPALPSKPAHLCRHPTVRPFVRRNSSP
jgi:hypothetical protein